MSVFSKFYPYTGVWMCISNPTPQVSRVLIARPRVIPVYDPTFLKEILEEKDIKGEQFSGKRKPPLLHT